MSVFICPVCGISSHCGKKYEWKSGVSAPSSSFLQPAPTFFCFFGGIS